MKQQGSCRALPQIAVSAAAFGIAVLLSGCASSMVGGGGSGTQPVPIVVQATGSVHGGQNPVWGATIQLYTVGTSANGAQATALIGSTITSSDGSGQANSNANAGNRNNTMPLGDFTLSGAYNCTSATQVYIVATGGNPGGGTNGNLSMMAALGPCANLLANASTTVINIDEVTTVAAAYALAPFATDLTHIGSASATGLANAFANAQSLANTATGTAGGASLPAGAVAPVAEINTLANIIASCVNTTGAASPACTTLFGATGASDTFGAALAMAKHPGASTMTALYTLSTGTAPFQPSMSTQPNDWTVAMKYNSNGGFSTPWGIAVDGANDVWVTNETGATATELSAQGAVMLTPSAGSLAGAQGVAIDNLGTVWIANTAGNSVVRYYVLGGALTHTDVYTGSGISGPTAIAFDSANNAFIANFTGNSVTKLDTNGNNAAGSPFTGNSNNITQPTGIAIGHGNGGVYVTSGLGYVVKMSNAGVFKNNVTDNMLQGPVALAINNNGNIGVTGYTTGAAISGALGEFNDSGSVLNVSSVSPVTSGLSSPQGIATDGTSFWVANGGTNGSLAQFAYGAASPSSPAAGFGSLNAPVGVAVDGAGCVWTANSGDNTVSQFIGLALPAVTPIAANAGP